MLFENTFLNKSIQHKNDYIEEKRGGIYFANTAKFTQLSYIG